MIRRFAILLGRGLSRPRTAHDPIASEVAGCDYSGSGSGTTRASRRLPVRLDHEAADQAGSERSAGADDVDVVAAMR